MPAQARLSLVSPCFALPVPGRTDLSLASLGQIFSSAFLECPSCVDQGTVDFELIASSPSTPQLHGADYLGLIVSLSVRSNCIVEIFSKMPSPKGPKFADISVGPSERVSSITPMRLPDDVLGVSSGAWRSDERDAIEYPLKRR